MYQENAIENTWRLQNSSQIVQAVNVLMQCIIFNPLRPSDAYMRRWTGSSLVQIMACRLFGAKPLSELMLENC